MKMKKYLKKKILVYLHTECKNPKVARTKNGRIMLLSNCVLCDSNKSKFLLDYSSNQESSRRFLSSSGIKTPLSKIPLVGPFLF